MFTPAEIEAFSMAYDAPMRKLENQIMTDIVRRIRINGEITRAADWQINRLHELGVARNDIKKAIADNLNIDKKEVEKLYREAAKSGYVRDASLYMKAGEKQIPFGKNAELQQLISAVASQTSGSLSNITASLGFAVRNSDGTLSFQLLSDYYQTTLDNAVMGIAAGTFDYNTVLKRIVREMTDSGLRYVDYAGGTHNRVDVAARRAVVTGFSQLTAKVNESNAEELGTEYFEVSYHGGARPTHQEWQGRVYTKEQLVSVCGLGSVTGLCGANCYHDYYPFIPGISVRSYTDEELDRMNAEENVPVEYNGREYTRYEALQRQRKLETVMRAERQKIKLLQEGNAEERDIIAARAKYRGTSHEYAMFSQAMGLPQQRERVTVDGLRNIGVGKYKQKVPKALTEEEKKRILKEKIDSGKMKTNIDVKQQPKHQYSKAWKNQVKQAMKSGGHGNPKSVLDRNVSPEELVEKYSLTGRVRFNKSQTQFDEFVNTPVFVGRTYDDELKRYVKTKTIQIRYTSNGIHVFPTVKKEDK